MSSVIRQVNELSPHPEVERLFEPLGVDGQQALAERMAAGERFAPLLIDQSHRILAGVENWQAAGALGWKRISAIKAPPMNRAQTLALIVAENIKTREIREQHTYRGMNNFFDMQPLRPPGGW